MDNKLKWDEQQLFENFLKTEDGSSIDKISASERLEYIISSIKYFPYIRESWLCSKAMSLILKYGEIAEEYEKVLNLMSNQYPEYDRLCKYEYQNKALILFSWSRMLEHQGRHHDAVEMTKKAVLMQFVDNSAYDGWEFLSFRACTKYVLSEIADEEISLMHPDEFNKETRISYPIHREY